MNEHQKSIFEFVREKYPQYKEKSAMFKRRASQYGREVIFFKQTFIDYKDLSTKEILERLYPQNLCLKEEHHNMEERLYSINKHL